MCQPKKWWIGLLPLLALWLATLWYKTAPIEADLGQRSNALITAEKASDGPGQWTNIAVAGRDVTISGVAPADGLQVRAAEAAERTFGVRLVNSDVALLAEQKPFTWTAVRDGAKVTLSGFVAPDAREPIIAAAKAAFPGAAIDDQMKLARGAPAAMTAMAGFGLSQLAKLEKGTASLADMAYSIVGAAPTSDVYNATLAATKALPNAMTLAKADITPPAAKPYVWSAEKNASGVTLNGFVPSDAARTSIVDAARKAFAGASVTDKMQLALGAPQNFIEAATAGLNQLSALAEGKASLSDLAYSLTGRSPNFAVNTSSLTTEAQGKLPAGFASQVTVDAPAPPPPPPPPPPPLPTARPFVWSVSKAADAIAVTGFAPSEAAAKTSADAARALSPAVRFANELRVAQGLPDGVDFNAATAFATAQINPLRTGAARITDNKISVTGEAPNLQVYQTATRALDGALPGGLLKDQVAITVAPYGWGIASANNVVTLTGLVPDARARQDMLAAAAKAFPNARIVDQLNIAAGAPSCYGALTTAGISQLARLESGAALFDGSVLRWTGMTADKNVADQINAAASTGWPNCARGAADLTVKVVAPPSPPPIVLEPPPAVRPMITQAPAANPCTGQIRTALEKDRILFDTARATIKPESRPVLEDIAKVLTNCASTRFEVAAHTDSDGGAERNMDLSNRRAAAVVDYLTTRLKIPAAQLVAKGYGETKPIASNDTAAGKQQNRRVEFNLAN